VKKPEVAKDDEKPGPPRAPRAPLVITIVVLAVVGSAYYAYYRKQADYYTGRNLRLLSMLTAQVEGRVEMIEDYVRARDKADAQGTNSQDSEKTYSAARIRFGDCAPPTSTVAAEPNEVRRSIDETGQGWRLRMQTAASSGKTPTCATVAIDDVARPIFSRKAGAAFDALLVAKDDGTVLYSVRPPSVSSTLLGNDEEWIDDEEKPPPTEPMKVSGTAGNSTETNQVSTPPSTQTTTTAETPKPKSGTVAADRESGSTLLITNLKALLKRKGGWRSEPEAIKPADLTQATDHMTVTLGGNDYVLFTQPYTYTRAPGSIDGKQNSQWIVCGLVSASRFRYDVSAVSTSIVLIAIAVALLALCCWPYLRIALIDPSQPLTITDVVLIIICTIVGAGVITLALLDAFAYHGIVRTADDQLEQFSRNVNVDFQRNVAWGMDVLSAAEKLTIDDAKKAGASSKPVTLKLPASLMTNDAVNAYPYVDAIAWIGDDGMQRVRFSRIPSPPNDVSSRRYFKLAKLQRTWSLPENSDHPDNSKHPYILEWVRSKATGEVRAVLAKKTDEAIEWESERHAPGETPPPFAVISLATELIDISHTVSPPGVEMAIIDEDGEVVYHSDTQRIGYENFFAEADRDRDLRSAVVARRAGPVNASYWGDDQSMFVMPLAGSRWTLVTFRAKRLTRVLNVEATLLTLVMLLFSSAPYVLFYVLVLLLWPAYRAPRLWPDERRHGDYLRLSIILIAIVVLFSLNNYALAPWSAFYGIPLIGLLSIVTVYLVLHRTGAPRRLAIAKAAWIVVTAAVIAHLILAEINTELFFSDYAELVRLLLVVLALAVGMLTFLLVDGWKRGPRTAEALRSLRARFGYTTLYRFCGVLLLIIGVALPVTGFFTISRHVESALMVKYGQLRAAADLEHRIDHLVTLNALPANAPPENTRYVYADILSNRMVFLFGSRWRLDPSVTNAPPWPSRNNEPEDCPDTRPEALKNNMTIPPEFATWLPTLYEDSIAIQPLFEGGSTDKLWHWCVDGRFIKLVRKIHVDRDVAQFVWAQNEPDVAAEKIVIVSRLPRASFWKSSSEYKSDAQGDEMAMPVWQHTAALILISLPLLGIFWFAAGFVAKRVLLIDIHEPDWLARKPLSPTLGEHIFLVRRNRDVDTLTKGLAFVDVSFEALDRFNQWRPVLETLDSSEAGRNVRVVDFEYCINDGAINKKKLDWLEALLSLTDRTLIVVSSVSPAYIQTTSPPRSVTGDAATEYFERWRALLDRFVCVTAEELDLRHEEWERRNKTVSEITSSQPQKWLAKETANNAFLRRLNMELEADTGLDSAREERDPDTDRRRLLDELGERAETYFAGLWASCRADEKLLLYQLAHNGLANGRNRRALRRLMARGLVRRNPNLELFSESFRLYVIDAAQRENIVSSAREERGPSTWDALRLPFFVIIISFILLLFATQKDMLTTTTALATALTTGLPVLMKLIGVFTERRVEGKG